MNILIFGASGFIGHAAFNFFKSQHRVIGIDVHNPFHDDIIIDHNFSLAESIIKKGDIDAIINCAGASNIQESFLNPAADYDRNTRFVEKIMICLSRFSPNTKFINLSSAAIYGNPDKIPISENFFPKPLSPYGKHKLWAEKIIQAYAHQHQIKGLSCRIFSAYGPGLKRQFFYDLSTKFITHQPNIALHGTGNESRDFIFIDDIMQGFDVLLHHAEFSGEVYNLAAGEEIFIKDAAQLYAEIFGFKGSISYSQEQFNGYPLNWKADIRKISALGFQPKVSLKQGLIFYCDWIKRNFNA